MKSLGFIVKTFFFCTALWLPNVAQATCGPGINGKGNGGSFEADLTFCVDDVNFQGGGTFVFNGPRDALPQSSHGLTFDKRDPNFFPFNYGYGHSVGLNLQVHLPSTGIVENGYMIYKLNEDLGVKLLIGDTNYVYNEHANGRVNQATGQITQLKFPNGSPWYISVQSLGASMRVTPVLLRPLPAGTPITPPPRMKIATLTMRLNGVKRSPNDPDPYSNVYPLKGKYYSDIYLDLSGVTLRSQVRTCRLASSPNVTLKFPTVGASSFPNVGALVYGATTNIALDCSQAGTLNAYAVLSDVNNPNNRSDILSIEQGRGKATGIGIKIFKNDDNTALRFGPQSAAKNTENQWFIANTQHNQQPNIRLTGYYVRTGQISAGAVNGQATITFSYQ